MLSPFVTECSKRIFVVEISPLDPNLTIGQEITIKCLSDLELQHVNVVLEHSANIPDRILRGPQSVPGEFHIDNVTEDMHQMRAQCFGTVYDDKGMRFVKSEISTFYGGR